MRSIYELKRLHETLQQTYNDFINNFKVENTELVVTDAPDINNKYHVTIIKTENIANCLTCGYWDDYANSIVSELRIMQRSINYANDDIENGMQNYDEIKDRIGSAQLRNDTRSIKLYILGISEDLDRLKNKYVWEF